MNTMQKNFMKTVLGLCVTASLVACGGGGGLPAPDVYKKASLIQDSYTGTTRDEYWTYDASGNILTYQNNGTGTNKTTTNTYDANGNKTRIEVDTTGDGVTNRVEVFAYDTNGNMTSHSYDFANNGLIDTLYSYTYNTNGQKTSDTVDYSAQSPNTYDEHNTYTYSVDANGNEKKTRIFDNNGDLVNDYVYTYTSNSAGDLIEETMAPAATPATPFWIQVYTNDANGNRLTDKYYSSVSAYTNNLPSNIETRTYDSNGKVLSIGYDSDANGVNNTLILQTYDTDGNPLSYKYYNGVISATNNGSLASARYYTLDSHGNQTLLEVDQNGDGFINWSDGKAYTYDANGNILTISFDSGNNGTVNGINTYTWVKI